MKPQKIERCPKCKGTGKVKIHKWLRLKKKCPHYKGLSRGLIAVWIPGLEGRDKRVKHRHKSPKELSNG